MEGFNNTHNNEKHNRFWTGIILVLIGGGLLAQRMGAPFPGWIFTWPMILIVLGLVTGIRSRFENFSWIIITAIGAVFLAGEAFNEMDLRPYFWPIMIIGLGLVFMLRPRHKSHHCNRWRQRFEQNEFIETDLHADSRIDSVSVFGGVKKVVTSKDFKGGEIICFMGGSEINLSQADITGTIVVDVTLVFGGVKLIVPPHWEIRSESIAIFGGIDDKRPMQPGNFDPSKVIIIRGTSIFGGIEIKSY
jgi:predicted membrane protein